MNQVLETVATWLADYYLLSSVLMAVSVAALALMRQPARRRALAQSVIVAMFVLGALCAVPGWSTVSLLKNRPQALPQHAPDVVHTQRSDGNAALVENMQPNHVDDAAPTRRAASITTAAAAADFTIETSKLSWPALTALIWTGGALGIVMWLALGSLAARRMRHEARPAPCDLVHLMNRIAALNSAATRRVDLLLSDQIEVAVALGIWRPAILLPAKWTTGVPLPLSEKLGEGSDGSRNEINTVLAHELTHIENRDLHWLAASRALLALLWAQPLFWLLRRRMRLDQEALADAAAAAVTSRQHYAEQLVAWARDIAARPAMRLTPAVGLWEGPSQLRQRIALLVDDRFTVFHNCSRAWRLTTIALCGALAVALSVVTFEPAQTQAPNTNPITDVDRETANAEVVTIVCVDRDGKPIVGAEVHLFQHNREEKRYIHSGPLSSDEKGNANFDEAITDKDGNFDRFVYARVPGQLVGVSRSAKWEGVNAINPDLRVVLQPSRSVEGQVTMPPRTNPGDVTVAVRTLHVINGPGDFDFESFTRESDFRGLDTALPEIFERRPDTNGHIRFDDIPVVGHLYLITRGKGLGEAQWWNGSDSFDKPIALRVDYEARLVGTVVLPDGKPAAGMKVAARISSSQAAYLSTFSAQTADNGEFAIDGLPSMEFTVSITDPNKEWVFRPVRNLHIRPGGFEEHTFTLEAGVKVSGRVVDDEGKPVEGAHFSAIAAEGDRPGLDHDTTDVEGRFEFGLPSGTAELYFNSLPDGFSYPEPQVTKRLEIQAGQAPIENLEITLHRKPNSAESVTDTGAADDDEEEQGSQMLRDIRTARTPILKAMAKDHGYGLEPSQDLRRVAPPFPPIRMEYYRTGHPSQSEAIKEGPSAMVFRWGDGKLKNWGMTFGDSADPGYNLTGALDALLDIKSQQIDGAHELLNTRLAGDWVVREGADQESVLKQLQEILQNEFKLPVKLEFREVDRDVYVARGEYNLTPLPGQEGQGKLILTDETITTDEIQIFGTQLVPNSGAGGGTGEFEEFLGWLGRWIGTPIVPEVDLKPTNQVSWHLHERSPSTEQSRGEDRDPILVLGNITLQTGLTFTLEKRPVRILFIERVQ
jgi:beta-lactamase regulating signal transducer with metallopeptidase domain